jgi:hypothetical protein
LLPNGLRRAFYSYSVAGGPPQVTESNEQVTPES